jgi:hypothetical protein
MQSVALSWLVYRLTGSTHLMGAVVFATQAPILFIGPVGGLACDNGPVAHSVPLFLAATA